MSLENSTYKVEVSPFKKKDIFIPTSKSYANRLLILAAIYEGEVTLKNLPHSTDVLTMLKCLKEVGLDVSGELENLCIRNSFPACEEPVDDSIHLETGDGGTTNRFLMGLLSLGKRKYVLHPTERIAERPVDQFIEELRGLNVDIQKVDNGWLSIQGPLAVDTETIEIDCKASTQFATAMQLVLSPQKKSVQPKNLHASAKYFDITNLLCKKFQEGIREFTVPLDFSSFGYPIALAAVNGELELTEFTGVDELQADSQIILLLKRMGADLAINGQYLKLAKSQLSAIDIDCSDFPDLVPTIAFLCSYAKGTSHLKNVEVLRHKESDRIKETLKILSAFSIQASYDQQQDALIIEGCERIEVAVDLKTARDHRMIMIAYLFMRTNAGGTLHFIEHINKSYPRFLEVMA